MVYGTQWYNLLFDNNQIIAILHYYIDKCSQQ
jgi:hypothetical protein